MVDVTTDLRPPESKSGRVRAFFSAVALWLGLAFLASMVVHFVVLFALPTIGRGVTIEDIVPPNEEGPRLYTGLGGEATPNFRFDDLRTDSVYCSFDLRDGAVQVAGRLDIPFWSMSVHTPSGQVVGSVNHNASADGALDMLVMRPALARDLAESGAQLPSDTLVVEMDGPFGLVRISGLAAYQAARPALREQLARAQCDLATFTFSEPVEEDADEASPAASEPSGPPSVPQPVPRPVDLTPAPQVPFAQ